MATASRKKFGILIGSGVLAGAAVVFFGFIWPPSGGTEGAIGQRQVYREGGVKASDVSVTPGTAPTVIKSFLQGKQFHEAARKDGFPEVDSKEFTALTENSEFLAFLATPAWRPSSAIPSSQRWSKPSRRGPRARNGRSSS